MFPGVTVLVQLTIKSVIAQYADHRLLKFTIFKANTMDLKNLELTTMMFAVNIFLFCATLAKLSIE